MLIYLARRIAWLFVVMLGVVTITFIVARLLPVDPARVSAGLDATREQVEQARVELGLDRPVHEQYVRYIGGFARLDFGKSLESKRSVLEDIAQYLPATLELILISYVGYVLLSIFLGVLWATSPGTLKAFGIRMFTLTGVAMPIFWMGLVLQIIFAGFLGWLPVAGRLDTSQSAPPHFTGMYTIDSLVAGDFDLFRSSLSHLILPATAWVFTHLSIPARLMRASLVQEMSKAYVRTARGKGLAEHKVILKHALRNALNPVVTMMGLQFGWLMGGTILIESVFSWPGIGLYAYNSFRWFDFAPIQALALLITFVFVVVNILMDLIYPWLDPRVKAY